MWSVNWMIGVFFVVVGVWLVFLFGWGVLFVFVCLFVLCVGAFVVLLPVHSRINARSFLACSLCSSWGSSDAPLALGVQSREVTSPLGGEAMPLPRSLSVCGLNVPGPEKAQLSLRAAAERTLRDLQLPSAGSCGVPERAARAAPLDLSRAVSALGSPGAPGTCSGSRRSCVQQLAKS